MKAYLDSEDVARLELATARLRDRLLIHFLSHVGCRITEALSVEVGHIDFARGTVMILHLKMRIRLDCPKCGTRIGKTHAYCPSCGTRVSDAVAKEIEHRRMRVLPVDEGTLAMLKEHVDRGGPVVRDG